MLNRLFREAAERVARELVEAAAIAATPFIIKTAQEHGPTVAKGVKDAVEKQAPKVAGAAKKGVKNVQKGAENVQKGAKKIGKKFRPGKK